MTSIKIYDFISPYKKIFNPLTNRLGSRPKLQIFDSVISFLSIFMVDALISQQGSSNMSLHNISMFSNPSFGRCGPFRPYTKFNIAVRCNPSPCTSVFFKSSSPSNNRPLFSRYTGLSDRASMSASTALTSFGSSIFKVLTIGAPIFLNMSLTHNNPSYNVNNNIIAQCVGGCF